MSRTTPVRIVVVVAALTLAACARKLDTAERVADAFVDAYYVEVDHAGALRLAEGPAADRLRSETALAAEGRPRGSERPTEQTSRVYLEKAGVRDGPQGRVLVTYKLRIQPEGGPPFFRGAIVSTEKRPAGWRVVYFEETDAAPPHP